MAILSRYDAYNRLASVLQSVDDVRKARADKMTRWKSEKLIPSGEAILELDKLDRQARQTAERSMKELKKAYKEFLQSESLPFTIREVERDGIRFRDICSDVSGSDMRFLELLDHFKLSKAEVEYLGQYCIDENRPALARALKEKAESWGFDVKGLCTDPDQELKEFDRACNRVSQLLKPIQEGDYLQETHNAIFRDELREMIENSRNAPQIEVTKKPESVEESIVQDLQKQKEAQERSVDAFGEKMQFVQGFSGSEGVENEMMVEAKTRANLVHMDNVAKEEAQKEE